MLIPARASRGSRQKPSIAAFVAACRCAWCQDTLTIARLRTRGLLRPVLRVLRDRLVGSIPLGQAAVGLAVSPDGRWLYATSEVAAPAQHPVSLRASAGRSGSALSASQAARAGIVPSEPPGTLTLIGLQRAETDPAHSVVATVDAGCQPVRVVTAANGTQVWVTARASDDVLCFAAALLVTDPSHALAAVVRVGEAPVGLTPVRDGTLIMVADSNRFGVPGPRLYDRAAPAAINEWSRRTRVTGPVRCNRVH